MAGKSRTLHSAFWTRALVTAASLVVFGCASTPVDPWHRHLVLEVHGHTVMCVPSEVDVDPPAHMEGADSFLCEMVQARDYAPCRIQIDPLQIWCAIPPGSLWAAPPETGI